MKASKRQSMMRAVLLLLFVGCILVLVFWLYPRNSAKTPQTETEGRQQSEAAARGEKRRGQIIGYTPLARFSTDPKRRGYGSYHKARVLSKTDQRPVAGASVTFFRSRDPQTRRFAAAVIRLLTDSEGFFQLTHQSALEGWLVIEKPGFAAIEEQMTFDGAEKRQQVYLLEPARAALRGMVLEASSRVPVDKVFIAITFPSVYVGSASTVVPQSTVTDSHGRFSVDGLKAGSVMITASAPGYFSGSVIEKLTVEEEKSVVILVTKGEECLVVVRDRDGEPIPGAVVAGSSLSGSYPAIERGNLKGEVRCLVEKGSPPSPAQVAAEGYLTKKILLDSGSAKQEVVLERADRIQGRVLSESGNPIVGANVYARRQSHEFSISLPGQDSGKTDDSGDFSFYPRQIPTEQLTITHDQYLRETFDLPEGSAKRRLEIRLRHPEGGICGRVTNSRGGPVVQFALVLRSQERDESHRFFLMKYFANPEGRFEILNLPAGHFNVEIMDPESGAAERGGSVTVLKGQVAEINIGFMWGHQ